MSWPSQWDACRGILVCEPFVRLHAGWVTLQGASRAPSDCTAGVEESAGGGCLKVASTNDCISSGQTSWIHLWREQGAVNFTLSLLGAIYEILTIKGVKLGVYKKITYWNG